MFRGVILSDRRERRICFCFQVRKKQILRSAKDDTHKFIYAGKMYFQA
jgi:hypothetical protein